MVQIGTIEYEAKVSNVAEARNNAEDFADSSRDMGTAAETAGASTGFLAGRLSTTAQAEEDVAEQGEQADEQFTLLSGTTLLLGKAFGKLFGIIAGGSALSGLAAGATRLIGILGGLSLSGVLGSVVGALGTFVGWLAAGSVGAIAVAAAIGVIIGLFAVWVLHITGVLDYIGELGRKIGNELPAWARDGVLAIIGLFAGPLAVIGGFIVGFIEGGFSEGFARAGEVIDIFFGAFSRTFDRIGGIIAGVTNYFGNAWGRATAWVNRQIEAAGATVDRVVGGIRNAWGNVTGFFRRKWNAGVNTVEGYIDGFWDTVDGVFGSIEDGVNNATGTFTDVWRGAKNTVVGFLQDIKDWIDRVMGPLDDLIGRAEQAAGAVGDAYRGTSEAGRSVAERAGVANEGQEGLIDIRGFPIDVPFLQRGGRIDETGAAVVHEGERVLTPEQTALLESGGTAPATGGGGTTVEVDSITVDLSGDFDPANVDRRTLESLADRLVEQIGAKTNRRSGVR